MNSIKQSTTLALMVCILCACQPIAGGANNPTRIGAEQSLGLASNARSVGLGRPLLAGDVAPDFRLISDTGALVHLADELKAGRPVVLIFCNIGLCRASLG